MFDLKNIKNIQTKDGYIAKIADSKGIFFWKEKEKITYKYSANGKTYDICVDNDVWYGENGNVPDMPQIKTYDGINWYKDEWSPIAVDVKNDLTSILVYNKKYDVIYKRSYDSYVISSIPSTPNEPVTYIQPPAYDFYTFKSFTPEKIESLTESKTVVLTYDKNIINVDYVRNQVEYTGKPIEFYIEASLNNSMDTPKIEYSQDGGLSWTETRISKSEVGEYAISYKASYDNYETVIDTVSFKISEIPSFEVTFEYIDQNEEETSESQTVQRGGCATPPSSEKYDSRVGYSFTKWDKDYSDVQNDLTVTAEYSIREISCFVYSQNSITHAVEKCPYGGIIHPIASCDSEPKDRWIFKNWYKIQGDKRPRVLSDDFLEFTQNNLSIWPNYERYYWLSVYTVSNATSHLSTFNILSGQPFLSTEIELPEIEKYSIEKWNPEYGTWNPIENDTVISAVYKRNSVVVTVSQNGNGTVAIDDSEYSETVSKEIDVGQKATLKSLGNEGYVFEKWDDENTENPRTIECEEDKTYTATFIEMDVLKDSEDDYLKDESGYLFEYE